jgi:hypothetical protein
MWLWGRRKKILFFSSAVLAVCAIAAAVWEDREKVWEDREKAKKANDLAMEEARAEMCRKGRTIDAPGEVDMISLSSGPRPIIQFESPCSSVAWVSGPIPVALNKRYNMHMEIVSTWDFEVKILSAKPLSMEPNPFDQFRCPTVADTSGSAKIVVGQADLQGP